MKWAVAIHGGLLGAFIGGSIWRMFDGDPRFAAAMRELLELSREREVAMLCSEREPERCHRATRLAAWIHAHAPAVRIMHLVRRADGALERIDSRELAARLSGSP